MLVMNLNPNKLNHILTTNSRIDAAKMLEPTNFQKNIYTFRLPIYTLKNLTLIIYNCFLDSYDWADVIQIYPFQYQFHITRGAKCLMIEKNTVGGRATIKIF